MTGMWQQAVLTLRLHFRNTMALIYGYLFPTVFLAAFWVLYRDEPVPLLRHMAELLTVSVLGGACFGLPTSLVSDRERGVWRRYRLTPMSTSSLVASTMLARYVIVLSAGLLQLVIALAVGMTRPLHPFDLWLTFTAVTFAFLGLGLVIAALADNVPAVQALGQCIFLPMLIIGGVAVPLGSLPPWALHVSAFFPGRYAVQAMQACISGSGLSATTFSLLALGLIGAAACWAGALLFRWDAQQSFRSRPGKGWLVVALGAWAVVGGLAEARGAAQKVPTTALDAPAALQRITSRPQASGPALDTATAAPANDGTTPPQPSHVPSAPLSPALSAAELAATGSTPGGTPVASASAAPRTSQPAPPTPTAISQPAKAGASASSPSAPATIRPGEPTTWQSVTLADIDQEITFDGLPSDHGIVTPIAGADDLPEQDVMDQLTKIYDALPNWKPGLVADPVQRVRNLLYMVAVPDVRQMTIEKYLPWIVFDRLQKTFKHDDLVKILYWVAVHYEDGDDSAMADLGQFGLGTSAVDVEVARNRAGIYAVKLLGRITGKITS